MFVWLTRSGARAADLDYPRWRPTPGLLAHVEAVTDVRLHVAATDPEARWISERDIPTITAGVGGAHRPDGLIVADDREIAVEVELTQKARARARAIVCELVARYPAVVYFTAKGPRGLIEDLAAEVGQGRVEVRGLPEATAPAVRR